MKTATNNLELIFNTFLDKKDEKSFRVLFYEYYKPLCAFAYPYLEDKTACEDVVQDVFFRIWKNRDQMIILNSAKNFLLTSVRNAALDMMRKKKMEEEWDEQVGLSDFSVEAVDLYTYKELKQAMEVALTKLPPHVAEAFRLNRFKGKTYAEIAKLNNLSVKTIEVYISNALALLRVELKEFLPMLLFFFNLQ